MSLMYFEGTSDYVLATPAIITTFEASGSITPGRFVCFNSATDQRVHVPNSSYIYSHGVATPPAGLAIQTVASGDPCPVVVFGYCKNIATLGATAVTYITCLLTVSGAGYVYPTSSAVYKHLGTVGRAISGSASKCIAFVNTMC